MRNYIPLVFILLFGLTSFNTPDRKKVLVIQQNVYHTKINSLDTIYLDYNDGSTGIGLDDSILKHCGSDTSFIATIFVANPGHIIEHINFRRFVRLKHLILAGNDDSYLDSIHFSFFDNPNLKKITLSSVYMTNSEEGHKGYRTIRNFIHSERKDIKVRFKPMGTYDKIGWQ